MLRNLILVLMIARLVVGRRSARADIVTDWNDTLARAATVVTKHNPGVPTRAMAMMNGSIYDIFQAVNRTHAPFKVNTSGARRVDRCRRLAGRLSGAERHVSRDASEPGQHALATRLGAVSNGAAKTAGIDLGNYVAQHYINAHQNDGWDLPDAYTPTVGPGHWSTDPMVAPNDSKRLGIGLGLRSIPGRCPIPITSMRTPFTHRRHEHPALYGRVQRGERVRCSRQRGPHADQTEIGLFWAYDRPRHRRPPVLFIENMVEIGNASRQHAGRQRADVCHGVGVAGGRDHCRWDTKYEVDLWRPITAIRGAARRRQPEHGRGSKLGIPGCTGQQSRLARPTISRRRFRPTSPATPRWAERSSSRLELFYGTNDFSAADASIGVDPVTGQYTLHSTEAGRRRRANYVRFTQIGPLGPGLENSPEGENSMSRIYLGVHWRMDQEDGKRWATRWPNTWRPITSRPCRNRARSSWQVWPRSGSG